MVGGESITIARGGMVGGESITIARGGMVGGESITIARGGMVGGESATIARGGMVGGESVNAIAELATAQPANKAIKLTFIVISPIMFSICAMRRHAEARRPALIKATLRPEFPHIVAPMVC
jgi:hypothetical protein